ncbi:MAG TPA: hypothetical protein VF881_03385 [Polyangiaceae bacterium]
MNGTTATNAPDDLVSGRSGSPRADGTVSGRSGSPPEIYLGKQPIFVGERRVAGEVLQLGGELFYRIANVQQMRPFLMSVVSDSDHWLFAASNGGLTAGRRNPSFALFPYTTEDKIVDGATVSGPHTAVLVTRAGKTQLWHPFRDSSLLVYAATRHLYKSVLGNQIVFEEVNAELGLSFRYGWSTSDRFGFVRRCTLHNLGSQEANVRLLDGIQNILPSDIDENMQQEYSCLLDAYKKNELFMDSGLALYTLAAQVVDRPEARESLHATTVWSIGFDDASILLSSEQNDRFDRGSTLVETSELRGRRGAYFLETRFTLEPSAEKSWTLVADVHRSQVRVSELVQLLMDKARLAEELDADIRAGSRNLQRIVASTDGLQLTGDRAATCHQVANVLFNDMRGGIYAWDYSIPIGDFSAFVRKSNVVVGERHDGFLRGLGTYEAGADLLAKVVRQEDPDLERLAYEYLPLTFSRRHGDPSRPWNRFDIRVRDDRGNKVLGFQGNWRDIFQNWEALSQSYPEFTENIIAKFVNASTVDGYNPYRITHEGIDWEVPDPGHAWAFIGYWGDHQIVYLLKLLEVSRRHHPDRLTELLEREIFAYANVPYEIKRYRDIKENPRDTIVFDAEKNASIGALAGQLGSDGKLVLTEQRQVYRVNLVEKLLVTVLAKIANFVPGGGIWLNTQRPEWNDANNALVGLGVSMVTLYHLARFFRFLDAFFQPLAATKIAVSNEVRVWLAATHDALEGHLRQLRAAPIDDRGRERLMDALGGAADAYRQLVYRRGFTGKTTVSGEELLGFVDLCSQVIDVTRAQGRRADGLYHAYNLLVFRDDAQGIGVEPLYEMLEGQVAALSAGTLTAEEAVVLLDALAKSSMYRADQKSYTLYPDRALPKFLEKNVIDREKVRSSPILAEMVARGDASIIVRDAQGRFRFHPDFVNADRCREALERLRAGGAYPNFDEEAARSVLAIYEEVFRHRAFTGRSGAMFAYEGLGSIYWHMVAKLLLAIQESFFFAVERGEEGPALAELARRYYEVREGLGGFNKAPDIYGAFPWDPYSHTPLHGGARQPGMSGQVKEEVITRQGELGVAVRNGQISFCPKLLRKREFLTEPHRFEVFDVRGEPVSLELPSNTLAFTYCQVPVVYHLSPGGRTIVLHEGPCIRELPGATLDREISSTIFRRAGRFARIDVFTMPGLP